MKYTARIRNDCFDDEEYECTVCAKNEEQARQTIKREIRACFGKDAYMYSIRGKIKVQEQFRIKAQAMSRDQIYLRINAQLPNVYKHILCLRCSIPRLDYNKWIKELSVSYSTILANKWKGNNKPFAPEVLAEIVQGEFDVGSVANKFKEIKRCGEKLVSWGEETERAVWDDILSCIKWYNGKTVTAETLQRYLRTVYSSEGTK